MFCKVIALFFLFNQLIKAQYSLGVHWGQNKVRTLYPYDQIYWEQDLSTVCSPSSPYDTIYISWMRLWFSTNAADGTQGQGFGLSHDYHCAAPGGPTSTATGTSAPTGANNNGQFGMLSCPDVGTGINACKAAGKKVILSMQPSDSLPSVAAAKDRAHLLYQLFFTTQPAVSNGVVINQPYGSVIFDGIDLFIRGPFQYLPDFLAEFRMLTASFRPYVIVSPGCAYPDSRLGPLYNSPPTILQTDPTDVDQINLWFVSSPQDYRSGNLFWSTLNSWLRFSEAQTNRPRIFVGLPATEQAQYVNAAAGDYVSPVLFMNDNITPRMKIASTVFAGIVLFDQSFDRLNKPCGNDPTYSGRTYASFVRQQLVGDISLTGNKTANSSALYCNVTSQFVQTHNGSTDAPGLQQSGAADGVGSGIYIAAAVTIFTAYQMLRA